MSQRTPIRLKNGATIGHIETASDGKQKAIASNGGTLGTYDPKSDVTRAANGSTIGKGNLLSHLIMESHEKKAA